MLLITFLVPALLLAAPAVRAHSLEEVHAEFRRMQLQPSEAIIKLTKTVEHLKGSAEGDTAHTAQHDLLYQAQRQANKERCTKLMAEVPKMDRKIVSLKQEGRVSEAEKLELLKDKIDASTKTNCNFLD